MSHKTRTILIVSAVVIAAVLITVSALPKNELVSIYGLTPQVSIPEFFQYNIVDPNQNSAGAISCVIQQELHATLNDGTVMLVAFNQEGNFDPNLIIGDLLDQYGRTLQKVDGILQMKCNPLPSVISNLSVLTADGGSDRMIVFGFDANGKQIQLFDTGYVNIPANQVVNGKTVTLGSWSLSNSQITQILGYTGLSYNSQIQGFMSAQVDFKYQFSKTAQFQYLTTTSAPVLFTVKVTTPPNPIVQVLPFLYTQARLTLTDPSNGNVNQATTSLLRGEGEIDGYDTTTIGIPTLEVYYTDQNANIQQQTAPVYSYQLTQYTKTSTGAVFPFAFPVGKLEIGTYTIKFYADHTNTASTSFVVSNKPSTPSSGGTTQTGTGGGANIPCGSPQNPCGNSTSGTSCGSPQNPCGSSTSGGSTPTPSGIISDFSSCLSGTSTLGSNCYFNSEFVPIYVVVFILLIVVIAASASSGNRP